MKIGENLIFFNEIFTTVVVGVKILNKIMIILQKPSTHQVKSTKPKKQPSTFILV